MVKTREKEAATETPERPRNNNRLNHALSVAEQARISRIEAVKAKTGRTDLPLENRKLTQQEAAAYCGVSTMTVHRWVEDGLKTVQYGARKRFLVSDLKEYMKKSNVSK